MLNLHGFSVSNYYNLAKAALLEKGLEFEEVLVYPSSDPDYLDHSPMGKVPYLETPEGVVSETQVILDYLEEVHPQPALYPEAAMTRAKHRELMRVLELYLELPARRLYPEAFFGGKASDETKSEVRAALVKGVAALRRLARFDPYIAGERFGAVDLAAAIHLPLARDAALKVLGEDVLAEVPEWPAYLEPIRARDSMQRVLADYKTGLKAYFGAKSA